MSLTGVTFANQKITPSDDGRLYGSILSDGILTGCAVTVAAATLSIAAGSMLIGTRELLTSGETLSITGATSGYARVIVDIDLTRAATKTSFEQAQLQIEYAASQDAFPALVQQDINAAGTHYQAVFCIVSLGEAGITGVVSTIGGALIRVTPESIGALPLTGGTLNDSILIEKNGEAYVKVLNTNGNVACTLDATISAAGIYLSHLSKWLIAHDGTNVKILDQQYHPITAGTAAPSGGSDGDIYLQYT